MSRFIDTNSMFKDKFVAYVDVLGFKRMVAAAESATEAGDLEALPRIFDLLTKLGTAADKASFAKYGPTTCFQSDHVQRDLDFQLTQISDCLIVSAEVSPAGVVNLVSHCWSAVMRLLEHGVLCRGYITRGRVYHTESQVIGSGYQKAYQQESQVAAFKREADERRTPFVEVDQVVVDYVRTEGDECVRKMFDRMTSHDGSVVALFPFKRLQHSFIIDRGTDPAEERRNNDNIRKWILNMKTLVATATDTTNPDAVRKAQHYIHALDKQLDGCDETDEFIDRFL